MEKKLLRLGIMSREDYMKRTIAIARGAYSPGANEPKIWFESIESLAQVLSARNQELLRLIEEEAPESLAELEKVSGRRSSNLSRTLHTLERYGIVELKPHKRSLRPVVKATDFEVTMGLNRDWPTAGGKMEDGRN